VTPYYQDDLVTIYHGDCREWSELPGDVLVTDPPYGYAHASNREDSAWRDEVIAGDESTDSRDVILARWSPRPAIVFGSWKAPVPTGTKAVLVWDKGLAAGMGDLSMPWKPNWESIYIIGSGFTGRRDSGVLTGRGYNVVTWASRGRKHPTEKPVGLMRDLIGKSPSGTIFDPFMGSGSTLVAAKESGRRAIGIEIEERYCEIAAQRCSQEVLGLSA
jgi:DNA modification methylase